MKTGMLEAVSLFITNFDISKYWFVLGPSQQHRPWHVVLTYTGYIDGSYSLQECLDRGLLYIFYEISTEPETTIVV
jgi:hypothetical protein